MVSLWRSHFSPPVNLSKWKLAPRTPSLVGHGGHRGKRWNLNTCRKLRSFRRMWLNRKVILILSFFAFWLRNHLCELRKKCLRLRWLNCYYIFSNEILYFSWSEHVWNYKVQIQNNFKIWWNTQEQRLNESHSWSHAIYQFSKITATLKLTHKHTPAMTMGPWGFRPMWRHMWSSRISTGEQSKTWNAIEQFARGFFVFFNYKKIIFILSEMELSLEALFIYEKDRSPANVFSISKFRSTFQKI